ncbi:MAG: alpha/beta fold hydrolase [Fimbriimonadaceae bacterium]|nr:alpha/beta fold hydrolase [Fimbriimonadaceae bacterium]
MNRSLAIFCLIVVTSSFSFGHESQPADPLPRKPLFGAPLSPAPTPGEGVVLGAPIPESSAQVAGLQAGDVITEFAGKKVASAAQVVEEIGKRKAGDSVKITYLRNGKTDTMTLTLRERPRVKGTNFEMLYHSVVSNGKHMRTLITKPNKPGKHPVLFIIGGLGNYSMDTAWGTGPYKDFLTDFAARDWVTVRVDKPGQGDSEGGPTADTDYNTELDIYRQALKATKEYDFVDKDRVYIFGHSMGGSFGPQVAAEIPVKGLAIYGSVYKTWLEYWLENVRRQNTLAGMNDVDNDNAMKSLALADSLILLADWSPAQVKEKFPSTTAYVDGTYPDGKSFSARPLAFWRQIAQTNFPDYWKKIDAHVLMMWGENEFISTREDHEMAANGINQRSPGKGTFILVKNSDHGFFQTSSTKDSFAKWGRPGNVFNPEGLNHLKSWIEACEKK